MLILMRNTHIFVCPDIWAECKDVLLWKRYALKPLKFCLSRLTR